MEKTIKIGKKKRRVFLEGYARAASRFAMFNPMYAKKLKRIAEDVYAAMAKNGGLEENLEAEALSAALCLLAGIHDAGVSPEAVAPLFDTTADKIHAVLTAYHREPLPNPPTKEEKGEKDETH